MNPSNSINPTNPTNSTNRSTGARTKFLVLLGLWLVAFIPVYPLMVWTWLNHSDNSHGILVPLVSLYFIWQKKEKLRSIRVSNSNFGAIILLISVVLYLLSYAGAVAVV